jgi:hypothetical protein
MLHSQGGAALALGYHRCLPPGVESFIFERYSSLRLRLLRMTVVFIGDISETGDGSRLVRSGIASLHLFRLRLTIPVYVSLGGFCCAASLPAASHEATAQIDKMAPITAREIVMGISSHRAASIFSATKPSMAPSP